MLTKQPKILIVYASYGDGHYQASKAIEACFQSRGISDIILLDLMAEAHPLLNELTRFIYMQSFKSLSSVYGWVYNFTREMQPDTSLLRVVNSLGLTKLEQIITSIEPDLIIHTFPQLTMPRILKRSGLSLPLVNVITDFDLHGRWIHPDVDQYYVATEELRQEIEERGIPGSRIVVSGIPLKPDFSLKNDIHEELHNVLCPGKKTVLLMAGAYGVLQGIRDICESVLSRGEYQIVAVCGRNEELYQGLQDSFADHPDIHLFGYVRNIAGMMRASDCIITKPGGITLSEAIACRLPVFVYRPVPGQELNNARYLKSKGIAEISYQVSELADAIHTTFKDEIRLNITLEQLDTLTKPFAADTIVDDIISKWFSPRPEAVLIGTGPSYIK